MYYVQLSVQEFSQVLNPPGGYTILIMILKTCQPFFYLHKHFTSVVYTLHPVFSLYLFGCFRTQAHMYFRKGVTLQAALYCIP